MFGVSASSGTFSNDYGHFGSDHTSFSVPPSSNTEEETEEQTVLSSSPLPNLGETETQEEASKPTQVGEDDSIVEDVPSMTLTITNVVCMANMRCHLRLKDIARSSVNVEYKALQNHVIMRLRKPYTVATIWSSGKIWCTGASSLTKARQGARRIARRIAKVGFPCRFSNYRIVNIMATCRLPFRVRLDQLVRERPKIMSYEPELAPGLNFRAEKDSSTSLKLFSTGRIVIMGSSLGSISTLVEELVPLAALHQTDEPISDDEEELTAPFGPRKTTHSVLHPFSAIAADVPALADVLAEEEAAFLNGGGFYDDEEEEDEGPVGTDDDSGENDSFASGASEDSGGCSPAGTAAAARRRRRLKRARARSRYETQKPLTKPSESISWLNAEGVAGLMSEQDSNLAATTAAGSLYSVSAANSLLLTSESKLSLLGANVVSGSTKRACITAYSGPEKPPSTSPTTSNLQPSSLPAPVMTVAGGPQQQQILRLPLSPALTPQQPQIIYAPTVSSTPTTATAATPQFIVARPAAGAFPSPAASPASAVTFTSTSYIQPTITVTAATNILPMDFAQRGITAVSQIAPAAGNPTAKIVTVNAAGQTSIVRIVNPIQFSQHSQFIHPYTAAFTAQGVLQAQTPGTPHQIVVGRLPVGTTVINCATTAAYPTIMPSVQLQPAQPPGTAGVVTTHPQFTNFVAPGYN
uniref:TATA box-binding protein-like protein 1 n=1 Tax=Schistocephalus solidus TaxID=70667 RepID=A0A0X3PHN7_SCHSO